MTNAADDESRARYSEGKDVFSFWASYTSIHGLPFAYGYVGPRRGIWLLLFFCSLGLSVLLVTITIKEYLSHKATTAITYDFDVEKLDFPSVTICNFNALSTKKFQKHNSSVAEMMRHRILPHHSTPNFSHPEHIEEQKQYKNANLSVAQMLRSHGLTIDELLNDTKLTSSFPKTCIFKKKSCKSKVFSTSLTSLGLCHIFNQHDTSSMPLRVSMAGTRNGLMLYMTIHADDVLPGNLLTGLKVHVHPVGTPSLNIKNDGFSLQPGTFNIITVRQKQV